MKKLLVATIALCSPLFGEMLPKHFHIDASKYEGEWVLSKSETRKGRYTEIWDRVDLAEGIDVEHLFIVSAPTSHGKSPDMKRMMRNSMLQVKFMPGTRTSVHRESENEAIFEWHTPSGQQAIVRILVEEDRCHSISHLRKGKERLSETEVAERADCLDQLRLTFSK